MTGGDGERTGLTASARIARRAKSIVLLAIVAGACSRGSALAGGISGYLEYNYSNNDSRSTDAAGTTTKTRTENFAQKYRLALTQNPYPNLAVNAGGFFEIDKALIETDGQRTDATATKLRPYADMTLSTPLVTAGGGYNRI